jgi:hypothetical protein
VVDGGGVPVARLLHGGRGLLLIAGAGDSLVPEAVPWVDRVDVVLGEWGAEFVPGLDVVLVRPDGYVAWTSPGTDDSLRDALNRWFGPPTSADGQAGDATLTATGA